MTKECNKCKEIKVIDEFDFRNDNGNYRPGCKECRKKKDKAYNIKVGKNQLIQKKRNDLKIKGLKHCPKCNTTQIRDNFQNQKNRLSGKMSHCKTCRYKIYQENAESILKKSKNNYKKLDPLIKKKRAEQRKIHYRNNPKSKEQKRITEIQAKKYRANRTPEQKKRAKNIRNNTRNNKRKTEPLFKFKTNCRSRTFKVFKSKGYKKNGRTHKMLGADYETVMNHIESQFYNGMNWSNQGEWHIDHITPLSSANTVEELIPLFHWTNLQPLWAEDNLIKGASIPLISRI